MKPAPPLTASIFSRTLPAIRKIPVVLLSAAGVLGLLETAAPARAATVADASLRCEYLENPLGIDVRTPRFTWQMADPAAVRGQRQTAYQILVASDPARLEQGRGDVWDSGRVASSQSALVPFAGQPLVSGRGYRWKVRVWDKDGQPSAWSAPARFSTGLFDLRDWTGSWIRHPDMRPDSRVRAVDVTPAVSAAVEGNRLTVRAAPAAVSGGIDPAPGIPKKLIVTCTLGGAEKTAAVLDGGTLEIAAPPGKALTVKRALYGDLPYPVLDVTARLASAAGAGPRRSLPVERRILTGGLDPAPGRTKALRVDYSVDGKPHRVTVPEGGRLELPAAGDGAGALAVDSAVFGDLPAPSRPADAISLGDPSAVGPEEHIWFRKDFTLGQPARSAFAHVASIGYHELYVNGAKVDDTVLAPALTRLDRRVPYVTYDIAKLLRPGANTIALWTGPGWARYAGFKTAPALRVQIGIRIADGKFLTLSTDESWHCAVSPSANLGRYTFADYGGETIDARREVPGWNAPGFDAAGWKSAAAAAVGPVTLSAQMVEPTRVIETIAPRRIERQPGGAYRVDMGKNFTGWVEIQMPGQSAGDRVTILMADDPGTKQDFGQKSEYVCKGVPGEAFRNRFNDLAGRYLTIEGLKTAPRLADITGFALGTALERTGRFTSSKELFNRIYETDLWTYRVNTVEAYTMDCPHRERLGYGEEAFATAWGIGLPNYRAGALYTKVVRDWADMQDQQGWINHTAPQVNEMWGGPLWSSAGQNIAWEMYQAYGDTRILDSFYPTAKRWLDFLNASVKDGVLVRYVGHTGKFLGDWAAPGQRRELGDSPEAQYFNNCVYAMNLMSFIEMARVLGRPADAALYGQRLADLRTRVHAKFFDPRTNAYLQGNQVQQSFALLARIVPDRLRATVAAAVGRDLSKPNPFIDAGSSGLPILLKYLVESSGHPEWLNAALSATTPPSYGYFLARGETAWPEYWNVDVPSRMHTCYTGIAGWLTKSVTGIRPDPAHPGFFLIEPTLLEGLTFAEADTETMHGPIRSRWEKKGAQAVLQVLVPPNSTATIFLPAKDGSPITEGGRPVGDAPGVTLLRREPARAELRVAAGRYEFSFTPGDPS